MFCTYACLAVWKKAGSLPCLASSLCCSRWSQSDCEGSGPPRGGQGIVLLGEETGPPSSCKDPFPPWKDERHELVSYLSYSNISSGNWKIVLI